MYWTTGASSTSAFSSSDERLRSRPRDRPPCPRSPRGPSASCPAPRRACAIACAELVVLDDDRVDDEVGLEADLLERLQVGRIRDRDEQAVAPLVQRQNAARLGDLGVDESLWIWSRSKPARSSSGTPKARDANTASCSADIRLPAGRCSTKRDAGLLRLRLQRLGVVFRHQPMLRQRAREAADVARCGGVRCHGLGCVCDRLIGGMPGYPDALSN